MSKITGLIILLSFVTAGSNAFAQHGKMKLVDALTKEPVAGATIQCNDAGCSCSCTSSASGEFLLSCKSCSGHTVSHIGYNPASIDSAASNAFVFLTPSNAVLNEVVVTASRGETVKRSDAPVAIGTISTRMLQEAKPVSFDQVLNKISGVNMVNLGNEQHQMSIRQPMTTKSLFLYLEDGIPVRTTGLFNHNAMLEMNMAAVRNIEVIKGPASALYGSEAIGGVINLSTFSPAATPVLKISAQASNNGYKRADLQSSISKNKWGFALHGYYAEKKAGFLEYSDFHKGTLTARVDYRFNETTTISNSLTWMHYYSDMPGGIDSSMFASRTLFNPQTFTYRKVNALRYRSTFSKQWNTQSKTTASIVYRDNSIGQNPAYRIKDDYRKSGNAWIGKKDRAHGEINESNFNSYAFIGQHQQKFSWKKAAVTAGISTDWSPSSYEANYISIQKDTVARKYTAYQTRDSTLTQYKTRISNYAAFGSFEFNPFPKIKLVSSLRLDAFHYDFNNQLPAAAFSGAGDTAIVLKRLSPKIGLVYNVNTRTGVYANYSQGFVPPQVTEMFTGVKVPDLRPAVFNNYEVGGWASLFNNKLSFDASVYLLEGRNEIVSVKLDDGSFENRNAGKTSHKGIEMGLNLNPVKSVSFRWSAAYSRHKFVRFEEKGKSLDDFEMNNAPRWMHNAEISFRPAFLAGSRISAEWQKIGSYYMDPANTLQYKGYDVLNIRAGYKLHAFDIWLHVMNATDNYFSYISTKSSFGHSYQLAEPRSFQAGCSMDIAALLKK